jgi:hypothetical protein
MSKVATREKKKPVEKQPSAAPAAPILEVTAPAPAPSDHAHRWRIESPEGEFSRGTCKICGEERMFPNSAEDYLWERDTPQSRWTGRTEYKPAPTTEGY